jgi:hypothetical protein
MQARDGDPRPCGVDDHKRHSSQSMAREQIQLDFSYKYHERIPASPLCSCRSSLLSHHDSVSHGTYGERLDPETASA